MKSPAPTTNWFVITGAPCSGKTAVINRLEQMGYAVVHEVARAYIDAELAKGKTLEGIKADEWAFERHILMTKAKLEARLKPKDIIFFDRAVPDSIAYYILENLDPAEATAETGKRRYRRIFMFERLVFREDKVRSEDDCRAQLIDELLQEAYQNLGYPIFRVPALPLTERTDWILDRL